jgi:hypothetical protein
LTKNKLIVIFSNKRYGGTVIKINGVTFYDSKDLAKMLHVHIYSVYRYVMEDMPCTKVGHVSLFKLEDVSSWLKEKHRRQPVLERKSKGRKKPCR